MSNEIKPAKKARLTKISDNRFGGNHPNGINEGYTKEGIMWNDPIVGQSFYLGNLATSVVTEIIDENTFKTQNSTYKIERV